MSSLPRLVITGASGFLARYVMRALKTRFRLIAIDRHPRGENQVPWETDVEWHQVDLGEEGETEKVFRRIAADGGAQVVLHLAAFYDFTGEDHPEYQRTNVQGLRYVLEGCRDLGLEQFIFASSVAACQFPKPGAAITEQTPPDGDHLYAHTKKIGEGMLSEYGDSFRSVIVRFAAMFSDWCEYPPLYHFLGTWLSSGWNNRMLGGRGESAVPYLHVRDAAVFLRTVIEKRDQLDPCEIVIASPDGAVSHEQLFCAATQEHFGSPSRTVHMPKLLCRPGMVLLDRLGRILGERPFERPWMAEYIDKRLVVDSSHSRRRLGWEPRPRLDILHRMPFLIENRKTDRVEWERRNRQMMEIRRLHPNLRIYQLLQDYREQITERFAELLATGDAREAMPKYQDLAEEDRRWNHRMILRNLLHSVRTRRKGLFMAYCRDLAERRAEAGFEAAEVIYAFGMLHRACHEVLMEVAEERGLAEELHDAVIKTIRFGVDQVEMVYEAVQGRTIELPEQVSAAVGAARPVDVGLSARRGG